MASLLSFENPVFSGYAFYGTVSIVKMLFMSPFTSYRRAKEKTWANPEDYKLRNVDPKDKLGRPNDRVERVRRNHQNDLENIPAFLIVGLIYVLTDPTPQVALWHFRAFAAARILHTISYQRGLHPARGICFFAGLLSTGSMIVQILMKAQY